jgi:signal transduction histidine kinase
MIDGTDVRTPTVSARRPLLTDTLNSVIWRRRWAVALELASDVGAPLLLSGVAIHELLYNGWGWQIWLLVAGVIWPLVLRRRAPLVVFVVCLAFAGALIAAGIAPFADLALLVALYSVAAHRAFRYALVCAVVLEAAVIVVAIRFGPAGSADDETAFLTGLALAALFLGTTLRGKRQYLSSVEDRAARLEVERAQQAQIAAAAERTRIAREMHDIVAHGLSVMITLADAASATVESDPAAARTAMDQVATGGRQSLAEMRKLFDVLRADSAPELVPVPDLAALDQLLADVRATGLEVAFTSSGRSDGVSSAAQATLYRIVQESLTNAMKHASAATRVTVALDFRPTSVRFAIQDDAGTGRRSASHWPRSGNGILGMTERVAIFDGKLDAGPNAIGWLVRGELRLA